MLEMASFDLADVGHNENALGNNAHVEIGANPIRGFRGDGCGNASIAREFSPFLRTQKPKEKEI
jgi:hypothetical protein